MGEIVISKIIGYSPRAYYARNSVKEYTLSVRVINDEIIYLADGVCLELGSWNIGGTKYNAQMTSSLETYFKVPQLNLNNIKSSK